MLVKFQALVDMAAKLRSKDGGCPWDQKQTIESLKKCILEEAQEVADAIDEADAKHIEEELGDLLFNMVLIAQIASEKGDFDMKSVLERIGEKIISRHTWVFGTDKASTPEEAVALWMKNKAKEKGKR